jgi:integrase
VYLEERKPHVSERTMQFEKERLVPLEKFFGEGSLLRIKVEQIAAYQRGRLAAGISGRTINMETGVLRRMLRRASTVAEDVKSFPERTQIVGKVLTPEQKKALFETAASKPDWLVAYCAGVLAVSTTCRKVEVRHLRWQNVDLFDRSINIQRRKRESGRRVIRRVRGLGCNYHGGGGPPFAADDGALFSRTYGGQADGARTSRMRADGAVATGRYRGVGPRR